MRRRTQSAIVLGILILTISSLSFAVWDLLNKDKEQIIDVGKGMEIIVNVNTEDQFGKLLIPEGAILGEDDVYYYIITYNVRLNKQRDEPMVLSVNENNVKIGGESQYSDLINIDIVLEKSTVNVQKVLVTIKVTLIEPPTREIYEAIVNQQITFDLIFSASL